MKGARLQTMDAPEYTIKDYVDVEAYSNIKHEFDDGVIRAMSGGTLEHSRLAAALILELGRQLEDGRAPCTRRMRACVSSVMTDG